jgi:hypothetical protein
MELVSWILPSFRWYRSLRGGYWARVTGFMWGKRWVKLQNAWCAEEVYPGSSLFR